MARKSETTAQSIPVMGQSPVLFCPVTCGAYWGPSPQNRCVISEGEAKQRGRPNQANACGEWLVASGQGSVTREYHVETWGWREGWAGRAGSSVVERGAGGGEPAQWHFMPGTRGLRQVIRSAPPRLQSEVCEGHGLLGVSGNAIRIAEPHRRRRQARAQVRHEGAIAHAAAADDDLAQGGWAERAQCLRHAPGREIGQGGQHIPRPCAQGRAHCAPKPALIELLRSSGFRGSTPEVRIAPQRPQQVLPDAPGAG